jgi:flavorubredoxin
VAPGFNLQILPAHFLHSEGQINVYDAASKILFTGDIGAAMLPLDKSYIYVDDFQRHVPFIAWFHRRYMCSNKAISVWLETISGLEIDMIAPQHGPIYRGQAVRDLLAWLRDLACGTDIMQAGGYFPEEAA